MKKVHSIEEGVEKNPILDRIWVGENSAPNCSVYHSCKICHSDIEYVRRGIEREDAINEVCEWLSNNASDYIVQPIPEIDEARMIVDLKKHLEGKK